MDDSVLPHLQSVRKVAQVSKFVSWGIACLTLWTLYSLCNLYQRGHLTELFATQLFGCAALSFLLLIREKEKSLQGVYGILFGGSLIFSMGAHTITAFIEVITFFFLILIHIPLFLKLKKPEFKRIACIFVCVLISGILILLPWASTTFLFLSKLRVSQVVNQIVLYDHIDTRKLRFSLYGESELNAQINIPLLVVFCIEILQTGYLYLGKKMSKIDGDSLLIVGFSILGFVVTSVMSVNHRVYRYLPTIFTKIQFGYRLVTYQNFWILIGLFGLMTFKSVQKMERFRSAAVGIGLGLSFLALGMFYQKTLMPFAMQRPPDLEAPSIRVSTFDGFSYDYKVVEGFSSSLLSPEQLAQTEKVTIPVLKSPNLGEIGTASFSLSRAGWVVTNVFPFPWMQLKVDERRIPSDVVVAQDIGPYSHSALMVYLDAGSHKLTAEFLPPLAFTWIKTISNVALVALLFFFVLAPPVLLIWAHRVRLPIEISVENSSSDPSSAVLS